MSALLIVSIHKLVVWPICNVVWHSEATSHHAVFYRRISSRLVSTDSGGGSLVSQVVIRCNHHIWVVVHLILLDPTALVEAHFSKWARNTVIILSHIAHDLHMRAYRSSLAYLRIDPLLRITISLCVGAHLCMILYGESIRHSSRDIQNSMCWCLKLIITLSQSLSVLILILSMVSRWRIWLWQVSRISGIIWPIVNITVVLLDELRVLIVVNCMISVLSSTSGQQRRIEILRTTSPCSSSICWSRRYRRGLLLILIKLVWSCSPWWNMRIGIIWSVDLLHFLSLIPRHMLIHY